MEVDTALLWNVRREFKVLEKKAKNNPIPDDILDIAGALRHLLIDGGQGLLKRGWDEIKPFIEGIPREPTISTIELRRLVDLKLPHIESGRSIVLANDVTMANGGRVLAGAIYPGVVPSEDLKKQFEMMERVSVRLTSYNSSTCMILNRYMVGRGTIIKYVANKLGARHYDTKRQTEQPKNLQEHLYVVLDNTFDFYGDNPGPHNLLINYGEHGNALHAAVLSMCQDFEESPDVTWFISTLDEFLQPPPNLGFK